MRLTNVAPSLRAGEFVVAVTREWAGDVIDMPRHRLATDGIVPSHITNDAPGLRALEFEVAVAWEGTDDLVGTRCSFLGAAASWRSEALAVANR